MDQIYHSKHFGYIDLSKIITITDPILSGGGQYVGFKVNIVGRNFPLSYTRHLTNEERRWIKQIGHANADQGKYWELLTVKGEYKRNLRISTDNDYTVAEEHIQEEINDLVNSWKSYCTAHAVSQLPRQWPHGTIPPLNY